MKADGLRNNKLKRHKYLAVLDLLLSKKEKIYVFSFSVLQVAANFLDLFSISLIGVAAKLQFDKEFEITSSTIVPLAFLAGVDREVQIFGLICVSVIFLVAKTFFSILLTKVIINYFSKIHLHISDDLFEKILKLPFLEAITLKLHSVNQIFSRGIEVLTIQVMAAIVIFISDFSFLVLMSIFLFSIDYKIALALFVSFGITGGYAYLSTRFVVSKSGHGIAHYVSESEEQIDNSLKLFRELRASNRSDYFKQDFILTRQKLANSLKHASFTPYYNKYAIEVGLVICLVIVGLVQLIFADLDSFGYTFIVFSISASRVIPSILRVQQGAIQIRSNLGLSKNTLDLIVSMRNIVTEKPFESNGTLEPEIMLDDVTGDLEFRSVEFTYPKGVFTLQDINLKFSEGSKVAIVGSSGSGKSTFVDLLLGLIEPDKGEILVGGINLQRLDIEQKSFFGYVPQETHIFNGTVRQNLLLRLSKDDISDGDIWDLFHSLDLGDFVNDLPDKLDSELGSGGITLSGGQKQRIGIARALIQKPRILVLDEITSALDTKSSASVLETVEQYSSSSTTIISVTHKVEQLGDPDQIILFENGKCRKVESLGDIPLNYFKKDLS